MVASICAIRIPELRFRKRRLTLGKNDNSCYIVPVERKKSKKTMDTPNTEKHPPLHTRLSASRFLEVAPRTIDTMVKMKQLSPVRIGKRDMFKHAELVKLVEAA